MCFGVFVEFPSLNWSNLSTSCFIWTCKSCSCDAIDTSNLVDLRLKYNIQNIFYVTDIMSRAFCFTTPNRLDGMTIFSLPLIGNVSCLELLVYLHIICLTNSGMHLNWTSLKLVSSIKWVIFTCCTNCLNCACLKSS